MKKGVFKKEGFPNGNDLISYKNFPHLPIPSEYGKLINNDALNNFLLVIIKLLWKWGASHTLLIG